MLALRALLRVPGQGDKYYKNSMKKKGQGNYNDKTKNKINIHNNHTGAENEQPPLANPLLGGNPKHKNKSI